MKRLIVMLGVTGSSLSSVFIRTATAPSVVLVLYRMTIAVLLLSPVVLSRSWKEIRGLSRRELALCMTSGVFLGLHFTAYFTSLDMTTIASSVVLVNTEVLFVAVISMVLWKKRLSRAGWCAILLAFAGSVVVAMGGGGSGDSMMLGNMVALAGALFMTVYTLIGSVCRRTVSTSAYTYLVYFAAAVTVLLAALATGTPIFGHDPINYWMALALAVFCTLMGHSIFSWGLKYLSAAFVAVAKLAGPVMAAVWGLLLFRESPTVQEVVGGAMVRLGLAIYTRTENDEKRPAAAGKE